jgi:hypothetical protein
MDNKEQEKTGRFEQGQSGNTAGRPKGSQNKITRQVKDVINKLLECLTDEDILSLYAELRDKKPEVLLNFIGKIAPKDLNVKTDFKLSPLAEELKKLREGNIVKTDSNTNIG